MTALHAPKLHAALEAARTLPAHPVTITPLDDSNRDIAWSCTLECPTPCPMSERLRDADWADLVGDLPDGEYLATPTLWGVELAEAGSVAGTPIADHNGYPVTFDGMTAQSTLPEPFQALADRINSFDAGTLDRELFLTKLLKAVPELQAYLAELRRHDANTLKDNGVSFTEQSKYLTDHGCPMTPTSVSNMSRSVLSAKDMARKGTTTPTRAPKTTKDA
ncbi:hypothetical protein ABZ619_38990 [Streptomyces sp. NPDC007851]|uniref:hypothetical protein n=1 Tax=Streptomyces sp. NPDC007851 TaxID=3155008 RepID=UPI0033D2149F